MMNFSQGDLEYFYEPDCKINTWNSMKYGNKFSIISMNIRSMHNKFSEFLVNLAQCKMKFSFIILTETWVVEKNDFLFEIPGYKCVSLYRSGEQRGCGIKVYCLNDIDVSVIDSETAINDYCEQLFVKTYLPGLGKLIIGAIYRPPNRSVHGFCEHFGNTLDFINSTKCVIVGDININILNKDNDSSVQNYIDVLNQHYFSNEINKPTYISPVTNTDISCLDHILTNFSFNKKSFILKPNLSDHYPVCLIVDKTIDLKPISIRFRDFSRQNTDYFKENLASEFQFYCPPNEANEKAVYLTIFFSKILKKYFPIKTKKVSCKRFNYPWITTTIVKCIRKKHRWYRMMKNGLITYDSYQRISKKLRKLLKMCEEEYYIKKLTSLNRDVKRSWRVLNKLLGKNKVTLPDSFLINNDEIFDRTIICEEFSNYFVNHPQNIHESVPFSNTDYSHLIQHNPISVQFTPCSQDEVQNIISSMKKEGSLDDISRKFLRIAMPHASEHVASLINTCLEQGIFPEIFKTAKINPVFKKGHRNLIKNYRPIAILRNIGKNFEAVIYARLKQFFDHHNLLSDKQYGFRTGKSTEMAILDLIHKLLPAIEDKKFAVCVFLDYSACFDTISRDILLDKAWAYGVRGEESELLKSYLTSRFQFISLDGVESRKLQQNIGVIQGSRLGPLLYDIYSNDFNYLCSDDENILYADDTVLVYQGDNLDNLIHHVNQRLLIVNDWCSANKLFLNRSKSEYMIVTNRQISSNLQVSIGNDVLNRVNTFRYLGVNLDSGLKFQSHIDITKTKLSRICGSSFKLRSHVNLNAATNLYYSGFYAIATYCISCYGGVMMCSRRCDSLLRIQKRVVKNLFSKFFPNSANLYKDAKILKLNDVYRLRVSSYMFRIIVLNECPTIRSSLRLDYAQHGHNTRNAGNLMLPFPRVDVLKMNFEYQFINIWNNIPNEFKNLPTISSFKKALINHCINEY